MSRLVQSRPGASLGPIITPTLLNSWVSWGPPYVPIRYWKSADGVVCVEGFFKSGTSGLTAFLLPAGYRVGADNRLYVPATDETGVTDGRYGEVAVSGDVVPTRGAALGIIFSLRFRALA